jgi:hypothetical protein
MNVVRLADFRGAGTRTAIGDRVDADAPTTRKKSDPMTAAFESCLVWLDVVDDLLLEILDNRADAATIEKLVGEGLGDVAEARDDFVKARDRVHRALARAVKRAAAGT